MFTPKTKREKIVYEVGLQDGVRRGIELAKSRVLDWLKLSAGAAFAAHSDDEAKRIRDLADLVAVLNLNKPIQW